jgi:hypothetical protein
MRSTITASLLVTAAMAAGCGEVKQDQPPDGSPAPDDARADAAIDAAPA